MARAPRRKTAEKSALRVVAVVTVERDAPFIGPLLEHLTAQGLSAYLVDRGATDRTLERASRYLGQGLIGIRGSDDSRPVPLLEADWFLHLGANDFPESPWLGSTLRDSIAIVDAIGYGAIEFETFHFMPTEDAPVRKDAAPRFDYYEPLPSSPSKTPPCWKGADVATANVFPLPFLLKRYSSGALRDPSHLLRFDPVRARIHLALRNRDLDRASREHRADLDRRDDEIANERRHWQDRLSTLERKVVTAGTEREAARTRELADKARALEALSAELAAVAEHNRNLTAELAKTHELTARYYADWLHPDAQRHEIEMARTEAQGRATAAEERALRAEDNVRHAMELLAEQVQVAAQVAALEERVRTLDAELAHAQGELARRGDLGQRSERLQAQLDEARKALTRVTELEEQLRDVFMSHSWRVTYPLRRGLSIAAATLSRYRK